MAKSLVTPEGRVMFEAAFRPVAPKGEDESKAKYTVALAFPPGTDLEPFKQLVREAADLQWGANKPKKIKTPFITEYEHEAFADGSVLIRPTSKSPPGVVDARVQPIIESGEFYSGCYARLSVHAFAWTNPQGGHGVSFGLGNIQKTRDGEPLSKGGGARSKPEDDFEPVGETAGGKKPASSDDLFA